MKKIFRTRNLALSATLQALGFPVQRIEQDGPRLKILLFEQTDELDKRIQEYWDGNLRIEPRNVIESYEDIKGQIYDRI